MQIVEVGHRLVSHLPSWDIESLMSGFSFVWQMDDRCVCWFQDHIHNRCISFTSRFSLALLLFFLSARS